MTGLVASLIAAVAVFGDRRNWRLLWRVVRHTIRELGRWLLCVAVLAGVWLMLAVAQAIQDRP